MDLMRYKIIEGFHQNFELEDKKPELAKLGPFRAMLQNDYSGENIVQTILNQDTPWGKMLNTKGFGTGIKHTKAVSYKESLISLWTEVNKAYEDKNEEALSAFLCNYVWNITNEPYPKTFLGALQQAMIQNRLWKNKYVGDLFCGELKFIESSAFTARNAQQITKERMRQIRTEYIATFPHDFWILKDNLVQSKLTQLFDFNIESLVDFSPQVRSANKSEGTSFTKHFYVKILSVAFDLHLVGNLNDMVLENRHASEHNVWNNLYLQTNDQYKACKLEALIDGLVAQFQHQHRYSKDFKFDTTQWISQPLTAAEIERYQIVINKELHFAVTLSSDYALIHRNTMVTQPEMVEKALIELDGLAYADDILIKVKEIHPEKDWTMKTLRASLKGENIYNVGKSALFGLISQNDKREAFGNGTMNDIMSNYLRQRKDPVHMREMLDYVNTLFPRPKELKTIRVFFAQDSKEQFAKFKGGFYGLRTKQYENTEFSNITGLRSDKLKRWIISSSGKTIEEIKEYGFQEFSFLPIQVEHLLILLQEDHRISLINGLYKSYEETEAIDTEENPEVDDLDAAYDDSENLEDELDSENVPDRIRKDSFTQILIRRGQPKFRRKLLRFYKNQCIITDCSLPEILEAAHILPFSEGGTHQLTNGLLLRADVHTLFDLNMIAIEPTTLILYIDARLQQVAQYNHLDGLDIGKKLHEINAKMILNQTGLKRRWEEFETE